MAKVRIFWDPSGFELNALGDNRLVRASDGDTPVIEMSIRMLSIETSETFGNPSGKDGDLRQLGEWIRDGVAPMDAGLAAHLVPRLLTGAAGTLHEGHGKEATRTFNDLLEAKLTRDNGRKRNLFLRTANEPFDENGRLLAYVAPEYSAEERERMTPAQRATFNLLMVESGWAASFPIYPSLPKYTDLVLLHDAAEAAYDGRTGMWVDRDTLLIGYEYRMCVRLHDITAKLQAGEKLTSAERHGWISRYCADMTTREIYAPQEYYKVEPHDRVFIWAKDVSEAVGKMNLTAGN